MALRVVELSLARIRTDETHREPGRHLSESITRFGLFTPIYVRAQADGSHELVDGSRRLAVARHLKWPAITAIVEPAGEAVQPKDLQAIILNTQRHNLQQLHLARHIRRLLIQEGCSQGELGRAIHLSQSTLSSMLRVLDCDDLVAAVEREELQFGAARALAALLPAPQKELLAEIRAMAAREKRLPSVRRIEELVRMRHGHAPLVEVSAAELTLVAEELRAQEIPVVISASRGKKSQMRVTLVVAEADEGTLRSLLAERDGGSNTSASPAAGVPI